MAAIADSLKMTTGRLFDGYSGKAGVFDRAADWQGGPREACRAFAGGFNQSQSGVPAARRRLRLRLRL
jgi:hypothetical protein